MLVAALVLASCAADSEPELLRVRGLSPDVLAAGEVARVAGEGFPIARDGTLRLVGECQRPGEAPQAFEREVSIHATSADEATFVADAHLLEAAGGRATCAVHGRVRFVGSSGGVTGALPESTVDFVPVGRERLASQVEGRERGHATASRLGLAFEDEDPDGGGLRVRSVAASSLSARAGIVPGDVVLAIDGVRLFDVADLRPVPGFHRTELSVRRAAGGRVDRVEVPSFAASTSSTASAIGYAIVAFLALLVFAFLAPSARFVAFLASTPKADDEATLAWLFGAKTAGTRRERWLGALVVVLGIVGMAAAFSGIALVGRAFARDFGVSILLSTSLALRMASRVFGEDDETKSAYLPFFLASAPLTLVVAALLLLVGTGHLGELQHAQGGAPHRWLVFANPIAYALFPVFAATALTRVEPEGTTSRLAMVAARAHLIVVSALGASLFLGGWSEPFAEAPEGLGTALFVAKSFALLGLGLWARRVTRAIASATWRWTVPMSVAGLLASFVYSAADLPSELERGSGIVLGTVTAIVLVYVVVARLVRRDEPELVFHPFL